nr:translation initiation factor IF-2 N-terminal domain-containing protein [Gemmatimonadaceae bacterium]
MIKLRVNDLAGEFGVSNDELLNLLRQMDVPVRSHLSEISDDQVARLRARWEREKRVRAEKPSSTPTRRRRSATAAPPPLPKPAKQPVVEVESAPEPAAATAAGAKIRRRRAVDVAAAATHAAEVEAAASADAVASKIAFVDAGMASAIDAEPVSAGLSPTAGPETREKQTAQVTVADPPPTNEMVESPVVTIEPIARIVPRPHAPPAGGASSYTQPPSRRPTPVSRDWQSPRAPAGGQRPTPVASGVPFAPPRPIATGVPGGSSGASTGATAGATAGRRDDKRGGKRRKKRGSVDQEAVTANISKTMTAMRGVTGRRVQRRDDFEAREEMEAQRAELIEREKKTVHV